MILFMFMMLSGRFIATFLMKMITPATLLASFSFANIIMCIVVAQSLGWLSIIALMAINFFFGMMFLAIFSLGIKNLGRHTPQGS